MTRVAPILLFGLLLAACGAGSAGPDTPVASPGAREPLDETEGEAEPPIVAWTEMWEGIEAPDPAWGACTADADCVTLEVGCCDHCNGGRLVALRAEHADAVRARYTASCGEVACTERGCAGGQPLCESGRCAFVALYRSTTP